MFPQVLLAKWFKSYVLPKVLDHLMQVFKLDQLLDYMEKENDARYAQGKRGKYYESRAALS